MDADYDFSEGKVNGPAFCRLLCRLHRFHLALWTESLTGDYEVYPTHESYIRRLPYLDESKSNQNKYIASTYLLNNCPQGSGHRRIWAQEFVVAKGREDMMFEGEDEICAWSYTEEDIDFPQKCSCQAFELSDTYQVGHEAEEQQMLITALEVD